MLVDFIEVAGSLDNPKGKISVNPRHVILAEPALNPSDPERQSFVTVLSLVERGQRRVEGSLTEVTRKLRLGNGR